MKRNDGFSLIELLVVIAVMAVLATTAIAGIGMLTGFRMNECVKKLDGGLDETRIDTMSRGQGKLTISCDANGNYYMQREDAQGERIANDAVTISYVCDDSAEYLLSAGTSLVITYDPANGKFCQLAEEPIVPERPVRYCEQIIVRMGTRHEASIRLVTETGRHYVE